MRFCIITCLTVSLSSCFWIARVSENNDGEVSDGYSPSASVSEDGRYVAFQSAGSNLSNIDVAWDDVFVRDTLFKTTQLVSINSSGEPGNSGSFTPAISADGRYVAFHSRASNLAENDTNGVHQIFVHDRQTKTTERVSVNNAGVGGDGSSLIPAISDDGRYVAFDSDATNLVATDTNNRRDVFVHDRATGVTRRVSLDSFGNSVALGGQGVSISGDGRYIAYQSWSSELVANDTNRSSDVFVHDQTNGTVRRVSVNSAGEQADGSSFGPQLSSDGRYIAFTSRARNLGVPEFKLQEEIYVHDTETGITSHESSCTDCERGERLTGTRISDDGRYVAWSREAGGPLSNVFAGYVRDRQEGLTWLQAMKHRSPSIVSRGSSVQDLSGDGRYLVFRSDLDHGIPNDTNRTDDIFIRAVGDSSVQSLSTRRLPKGATTRVTIRGNLFPDNAIVFISGLDISQDDVNVVNDSRIEVDVTVPADAISGRRTLFVWHVRGTGPGELAGVAAECTNCMIIF